MKSQLARLDTLRSTITQTAAATTASCNYCTVLVSEDIPRRVRSIPRRKADTDEYWARSIISLWWWHFGMILTRLRRRILVLLRQPCMQTLENLRRRKGHRSGLPGRAQERDLDNILILIIAHPRGSGSESRGHGTGTGVEARHLSLVSLVTTTHPAHPSTGRGHHLVYLAEEGPAVGEDRSECPEHGARGQVVYSRAGWEVDGVQAIQDVEAVKSEREEGAICHHFSRYETSAACCR
mmetsp:Transcript_33901/g.65525  ORF Transcript_33901/g.65525 Transcript_33901/m.65525 type:complete len:238 (-) Transcript_33901:1394-2107(-)